MRYLHREPLPGLSPGSCRDTSLQATVSDDRPTAFSPTPPTNQRAKRMPPSMPLPNIKYASINPTSTRAQVEIYQHFLGRMGFVSPICGDERELVTPYITTPRTDRRATTPSPFELQSPETAAHPQMRDGDECNITLPTSR